MVFGIFLLGGGMRGANHHWITRLILLSFLFLSAPAVNAAATAYTGRVNNTIGGVTGTTLVQRGFAANDPRYAATIDALSTAASSMAAAAVVAGTAPTWPAILAGGAAAALVGVAVPLAANSLVDWIWGENGTAKLSGSGMGSADPASLAYVPLNQADILTQIGVGYDVWYKDNFGKIWHYRTVNVVCPTTCFSPPYTSRAADFSSPFAGPWDNTVSYWASSYYRFSPLTANSFDMVFYYLPKIGETVSVPAYASRFKPVSDIVADIPSDTLTQPVSDRMLAESINQLWREASTSLNVIPWSSNNPVTPQQVATWRQANPTYSPTVADFVGPVSPTNTATVPINDPVAQPSTNPPPSSGAGTQVDLGPDPNIPAPALETTPTINQILDPIFGLMPDLKNFTAPAHQVECPTGSFSALGSTHRIDAHCGLIDSNRAIIQAAMILFWTLAATFIILRA